MPKKRILMPVLDAGAGHRAPAVAVRDAIQARRPRQYDIDIIDFAADTGARGDDRRMKGFWDYCLEHPRGARFLYDFMETMSFLNPLVMPVAFPDSLRRMRAYLAADPPDLIFSTHYFAISASARARNALGLPAKVIGYVTDPFDAFTFWCEKRVDSLLVSSERARAVALDHGFPAEKLRIVPFPIHERFFQPVRPRAEVLSDLGLDPAMPTAITSQGGQGIGIVTGYIQRMAELGLGLNVIAVCGKNEAARSHLEGVAAKAKVTRVKALGFVDTMPELLKASDFLIAKAGASTTFEAVACRLPTIFTSWAIQSERPNVEYLVERGAGWYAPDEDSFWRVLEEALRPDVLELRRQALAALDYHSGAGTIAEMLIAHLESGDPAHNGE
jgi:1,2-diacylglycerol 3-beta-galactosyltransferase